MPIPLACPCGVRSEVPDEWRGKEVRCKKCGHVTRLASYPGDRGPDGKVLPFDTGWRGLRNGKLESVTPKHAVTPLAEFGLGVAANPTKKAGPR